MSRHFRLIAGLAAAAALLSPGAASAQEERPERPRPTRTRPAERPMPPEGERRALAMDEIKSRCLRQIDLRHTALSRVKQRLANARFLTDTHEDALTQNIDATSASLSRLADVIQGEDNFEELREECRSIVMDHRVFVLVLPRARLLAAADAELAAANRLTEAAAQLQAKIDEAKAAGKDTTEAESDLARTRAHIANARDQADGVYDAVVGITPSQYNGNHEILQGTREAVRAAKNELRAAVAAAREVRQGLGDDAASREAA